MKPNVFRVYLSNHGYFIQDEFATLGEAIDRAKKTTFDCGVFERHTATGKDEIRASVSFFGGTKFYDARGES